MNNIFENAHFGKTYRTRDGRKAIYFCQTEIDKWHELIVEGETVSLPYRDNGLLVGQYPKDPEWPEDIVSEWIEPIDEKELSELAWKCAESMDIPCRYEVPVIEGFKAGYRKAMEGKL